MTAFATAFQAAEARPRKYVQEHESVNVTDSQLRYAMAVSRRIANRYPEHRAVNSEDLFQAGVERILSELQRRPDLHGGNAWMGKCAEYAIKRELRRMWGQRVIVSLSNGGEDEEGNEMEDQCLAVEDDLDGTEWILSILTTKEREVATLAAMDYTPGEITKMLGLSSNARVAANLKSASRKLVDAGVRMVVPNKVEQWVKEYESICRQQEALGIHANYAFKRDGSPQGAQRDLNRKRLAVRKATLTRSLQRNGITVPSISGE